MLSSLAPNTEGRVAEDLAMVRMAMAAGMVIAASALETIGSRFDSRFNNTRHHCAKTKRREHNTPGVFEF